MKEKTGCDNIFEMAQILWVLQDTESPAKYTNQFDGVPRGLPTSPIASIITLRQFLTQVDSISNADDPIFYSNKEFFIKEDADKGIIINKDKSS